VAVYPRLIFGIVIEEFLEQGGMETLPRTKWIGISWPYQYADRLLDLEAATILLIDTFDRYLLMNGKDNAQVQCCHMSMYLLINSRGSIALTSTC
jgi:hypothetical protein